MVSNHGSLYNDIRSLVLGCYGVLHAKVNGTGVVVGERNRTTNIAGQRSREGTGKNVEGRGRSAG